MFIRNLNSEDTDSPFCGCIHLRIANLDFDVNCFIAKTISRAGICFFRNSSHLSLCILVVLLGRGYRRRGKTIDAEQGRVGICSVALCHYNIPVLAATPSKLK